MAVNDEQEVQQTTFIDNITGQTATISPDVSFTKDSTSEFDSTNDILSGRIYFRKDGIFVNGYQYSEILPLTTAQALKSGIPESAWTNCLDLTSLTNGTYIIQTVLSQIVDNVTKSDIYSGIISYSGTGGEEILLHRSGNGQNRIFLKIDGTDLKIASTSALVNITLNIKLRKML